MKSSSHGDWQGVPCTLPEWIYSVDPAIFEARRAVQRFNSDWIKDGLGLSRKSEFTDEELILQMIGSARRIAEAARTVEQELSAEAQARGLTLRAIGGILGLKESGVSMYLKRATLTEKRKRQIAREYEAWQVIVTRWEREEDEADSEPAESYLRYGLEKIVDSYNQYLEFEKCYEAKDGESADSKIRSTLEFLYQSFESLTYPGIPQMVMRHAPKGLANDEWPKGWENPAIVYIYRMIHSVTIAVLVGTEAVKAAEQEQWDVVGPLLGELRYYLAGALDAFMKPEAHVVFNSAVEFLRLNHPYLLPSETISKPELEKMMSRKYGFYESSLGEEE